MKAPRKKIQRRDEEVERGTVGQWAHSDGIWCQQWRVKVDPMEDVTADGETRGRADRDSGGGR